MVLAISSGLGELGNGQKEKLAGRNKTIWKCLVYESPFGLRCVAAKARLKEDDMGNVKF